MHTSTLSQQLKEQTAAAHQQLEQRLQPYLMDAPTQQHYIHVLQSFYGFFAPLQEAIASFVTEAVLPDVQERRSAAWIKKDLDYLQQSTGAVAAPHELPLINNTPAAMGALYVLEGSTLGGRMITKHLMRQLPQLPAAALQFFSGYGEHTGSKWKTFMEALNQLPYNESDYSTVIQTANTTFLKMDLWIQKTLR